MRATITIRITTILAAVAALAAMTLFAAPAAQASCTDPGDTSECVEDATKYYEEIKQKLECQPGGNPPPIC